MQHSNKGSTCLLVVSDLHFVITLEDGNEGRCCTEAGTPCVVLKDCDRCCFTNGDVSDCILHTALNARMLELRSTRKEAKGSGRGSF